MHTAARARVLADARRGSHPGLAGAVGGGAVSDAVTYRAELSDRVLAQLGDFPAKAFDSLIATMAAVVEYPDDPMRDFPDERSLCPACRVRRSGPSHVPDQRCPSDCHTD